MLTNRARENRAKDGAKKGAAAKGHDWVLASYRVGELQLSSTKQEANLKLYQRHTQDLPRQTTTSKRFL